MDTGNSRVLPGAMSDTRGRSFDRLLAPIVFFFVDLPAAIIALPIVAVVGILKGDPIAALGNLRERFEMMLGQRMRWWRSFA